MRKYKPSCEWITRASDLSERKTSCQQQIREIQQTTFISVRFEVYTVYLKLDWIQVSKLVTGYSLHMHWGSILTHCSSKVSKGNDRLKRLINAAIQTGRMLCFVLIQICVSSAWAGYTSMWNLRIHLQVLADPSIRAVDRSTKCIWIDITSHN